MATEQSQQVGTGRAGTWKRTKYLVAAYPMAALGVLFLVPLVMLFVFSFYRNISGGYFEPAFTFENYVRFFTTELYLGRLWFTLEVSAITAVVSLVVGYPLAYYLARMHRKLLRRLLMIVIVSTLWITYVIRAYAWTVLLARDGIVSQLGVALGLLGQPQSFTPGYWALVVGMVYAFLPFMVLTLFNSIKNIDPNLEEASRNLGAGPVETFRRITLPLSKNGIVSGTMLVFILSLGVYVLPKILGNPQQWTLPIIIGDQIAMESNVPFGAAMSMVLMVIVVVLLWATVKIAGVGAAGFGGERA